MGSLVKNWVKLQDVAAPVKNAIVDGPFGSNLKLSDYCARGVPVLQGKNITNDRFRWFDVRFISEGKAWELRRSKVSVGDLLIVKIGSIGYSAIIDNLNGFPFAIIPANLAKVTLNEEVVFPKFIAQYLTSPEVKRKLISLASKTAQPALSLTKIKELPVPLPPLPIQKQIAAILEKADAAREKRRQANQLTEQFLQSAFLEMFGDPVTNPKGWKKKKILEIGSVVTGNTPSKKSVEFYSKRDVSFFKPDDFGDVIRVLRSSRDFLSSLGAEEARKCPQGTVLTTCIGIIGKVGILEEDSCFNQQINAVVPNYGLVISEYLAHAIFGIKPLLNSRANAPVVPILNKGQFSLIELPIPPLEKQQKFATLVEKVEALRTKQRENEKELEELFQSLMQRAFKGELVKEHPGAPKLLALHPTDRHAAMLGKIIRAHEAKPQYMLTLGHVKGEKISHLIEYHTGSDLGRHPVRDAAGPVDYTHLLKVEHRAAMKKWFVTRNRSNEFGKEYTRDRNLNDLLSRLKSELGETEKEVDRIINLFVPMKTEHAEVTATVYAAWNDLLLDRRMPSDEEIVREAREAWTPEKMRIDRKKFFSTIVWLRNHDLVPKGSGRHTMGK